MNNQIRRTIATITLTPILSPLLVITFIFIITALNPFRAEASALEATSSGINVLGLPTPVITGIDAKNGIVQLKAAGYINDKSSLLATVMLVNENGDVVDVAEKKVSDPENIRVSLHIEKIQVGDSIFAKFTNHGIEGDGADHTHDAAEPEPEAPAEPVPPTQIITERVPGSSSVTYIVTEAEPEQIAVEKIIEMEPEPAVNTITNVPVYIYTSPDNAQSVEESVADVAPEMKTEDMVALGEMLENTKTESEIIKPVSANTKILFSLLIILSVFLIIFTIFIVRYYLSKTFREIRQPLDLYLANQDEDIKSA